jgi:hypothetical protein
MVIHFKQHLKNSYFQPIERNIVIAPNNINNMTKSKKINPSIDGYGNMEFQVIL